MRTADRTSRSAALVFKIVADPHVGKLAFVRVYSGTLKAGSYASTRPRDKRERVGRLLQMHANQREEIHEVEAGDIAAIIGLKSTVTGDTLCDATARSCWSDRLPRAGHPRLDRAQDAADQDKMGFALGKLTDEDPTFRVRQRRRPARRSSRAWASCTSSHRRPADARVSASMPTSAARRSPTARRSPCRPRREGRFMRQTGGKGRTAMSS